MLGIKEVMAKNINKYMSFISFNTSPTILSLTGSSFSFNLCLVCKQKNTPLPAMTQVEGLC